MTHVTLRTEADAEAARVRRARRLVQSGDRHVLECCEADGPWVLIARHSLLRQRLGPRVLLIWRVGCDDGNGRCVEWQVVATTARLTTALPRQAGARAGILRAIEQKTRSLIEADDAWRTTAVETARSVARTRLTRERAIASAVGSPGRAGELSEPDLFQVGLFDRRAEHRRLVSAAASDEMRRHAAERITILERAATIGPRHAQLLLVVIP